MTSSRNGSPRDRRTRKLLTRSRRARFVLVVSISAVAGASFYMTVHGATPQFFRDLDANTVYFVGWIVIVAGAVNQLREKLLHDRNGRSFRTSGVSRSFRTSGVREQSQPHSSRQRSSTRRRPPTSRTRPSRKRGKLPGSPSP